MIFQGKCPLCGFQAKECVGQIDECPQCGEEMTIQELPEINKFPVSELIKEKGVTHSHVVDKLIIHKPNTKKRPEVSDFGLTEEQIPSIKDKREKLIISQKKYEEDTRNIVIKFIIVGFCLGLLFPILVMTTHIAGRLMCAPLSIVLFGMIFLGLGSSVAGYFIPEPQIAPEFVILNDKYHEYECALRTWPRQLLGYEKAKYKKLDGYEFEKKVAEVYRELGYEAVVTPGSSDGGVDIDIKKDGKKAVVQCKLHKTVVGPSVIRDLYGAMIHSKADSGIVVSSTGFSSGAIEFAKGKPLELIDLDKLIKMSPKFKELVETGRLA